MSRCRGPLSVLAVGAISARSAVLSSARLGSSAWRSGEVMACSASSRMLTGLMPRQGEFRDGLA